MKRTVYDCNACGQANINPAASFALKSKSDDSFSFELCADCMSKIIRRTLEKSTPEELAEWIRQNLHFYRDGLEKIDKGEMKA